ncbi:MAG: ABC transporter ATP-binding protein [Spirochaetia bacterium]
MIEVKNLYHDYSGKKEYAVDDVSFTIKKGEIFGFLGPSGAGKSTVQNIMTKLLPLQKGDISYNGKSIQKMNNSFFNSVGTSFEHPNLYQKLTGYENLKFYAGLFQGQTRDPLELLNIVGLGEAAHKKARDYSKGMKQRLVFARSLINNPEILFLDEPMSGLDPATAGSIKKIIREKQEEGTTIFLTTHNMFVADQLCDRVAFINDGRIVACDSPKSLKLEYGKRSVEVEYEENGSVKKQVYFLDKDDDKASLKQRLDENRIRMMHTQEATLEQIFIKLTGRGLTE